MPGDRTYQRYNTIRKADRLNDQHTPAEILQALAVSVTQEDLQEFLLSQIKRVIFGADAGHWNSDFGAEGILSLAQLTSGHIPANCLVTDEIGDLVAVSGPAVGGVMQVEKIDVTNYAKMPGIGVIVEKTSATDCILVGRGLIFLAGLQPGRVYFAGVDGKPSTIRPFPAPSGQAWVQVVGLAYDTERFLVWPSFVMTKVKDE